MAAADIRTDEVIRTDALTKVFPGGTRAVDGLDLSVRSGEIFGLLGPNGAGKTTTAGMLTTRVIPTSGGAYVGGIDVVAHPVAAKQVIGVVPQTNTLDRSLSVWENLYFHGRFFGMNARTAKVEATARLEQFRLADRAPEPVSALSGGMAQRLMVARAIMHRPATLFLDEPTAGLDPQSRLALWEVLGELHREGQTILLTTHYMEEADELCDRLAIIDRGKLLALGTPEELKASTGADTIVTVSAASEHLDTLVGAVTDEVPGVQKASRVDQSLVIAVRGVTGIVPQLFAVAERHAIDITDVSVAEPSLETVFINLTGKDLREMSAVTIDTTPREPLAPRRSPAAATRVAFRALLLRDAVVLRKTLKEFIPRTLLQPFLLVFVFTYVFPKIGQGVGGSGAGESEFSTILVAGVVGLSIMFQGIQTVALPMVQEFGYTREIEDRVLAPLPVSLVAIQKAVWGALAGLLSAILVFPIAAVVPATPVHLAIDWPVLLTLTPLACYMCGALGLTFGTRFDPRSVPLLFGIIVIPITFLGAIYYPWQSLEPIRWLQILVLFNPLVYMCEGFRAALTNSPHMSLWVIYPVMLGFSALFTWLGITGFKRRVVS